MADIHIHRDHPFTFAKARQVATAWAEKAENQFGLACTYTQGDSEDQLSFARSGVTGVLKVSAHRFELDAKLGFLYGAFKERIETEITQKLDRLLADTPPAAQA
jgi:putative polyhydroxyalkanoate system protein